MTTPNGIQLVQKVKQDSHHKFTPVIMLTTEGDKARMEQGRTAAAKAWLAKPFNPPQLLDAVSKLVQP